MAADAPPPSDGRWWHAELGSRPRPWLWLLCIPFAALWLTLADGLDLRDDRGWWVAFAAGAAILTPIMLTLGTIQTIRRHRDRWIVVDDDTLRAGLSGRLPVARIERLAIHRGFPRIWTTVQGHMSVARTHLTWWDPAIVKAKADRGLAPFLLVGTAHPEALVAAVQHARRRSGLHEVPVTDDGGPYVRAMHDPATVFDIAPPPDRTG